MVVGFFVIVLIIMIITLSIILLRLYIVSRHPNVPKFGVKSASISSFNLTSSELAAELNIVLNVTTHDIFHSISYDNVSISINNDMHNQTLLASGYLAPFSQEKGHNTIYKEVQLNMNVQHDVETDGFSNGMVNFEIVLSTIVTLKGDFNFRREVPLKVVCNPLSFKLDSGSLNWVLVKDLTCKEL
ncbi:hypothetical protein TSUD_316610 [Trifolium subterraneum]|uniref:Late embryogenesis abundant protein LEA-2 subgroup domain-containing protein n=1 Tax=Trifolium subterraneum TaxID=3900 RepID=A0A2Z6NKY2_TRISU|nr:hypothetical protein TSUD_316610 [Trifolium subterraneum]